MEDSVVVFTHLPELTSHLYALCDISLNDIFVFSGQQERVDVLAAVQALLKVIQDYYDWNNKGSG